MTTIGYIKEFYDVATGKGVIAMVCSVCVREGIPGVGVLAGSVDVVLTG